VRLSKRIVFGLMVILSAFAFADACPFCTAPAMTLSEQLAQSDVVALAQWVKGTKPDETQAGTTTYRIVDVLKDPGRKRIEDQLTEGDSISLVRYRVGQPGDLFALMGTAGILATEWDRPIQVTEASYQYLAQAPSPDAPVSKRLAYYLQFLEHPEQLVANDAYGEFAGAPYEDIAAITDLLPREKIRGWIADPETSATRLGLYGLMIGLCGTREDIDVLEQKITQQTEDFRLGIDGVMSGYILLTGASGLDLIDEHKLKSRDASFSETYAAIQAIRFLWQHTENRISKDRLRASMRILLERPDLADLAITDLARWKDWSLRDRLMVLYDTDDYNDPFIKRAVVRYMLVCAKDVPEGDVAETPNHVADAQKNLKLLRERDPKTVRRAERLIN